VCTVPAALNIPITVSTDSAWDAYNQRYYYRMWVSWSDPAGAITIGLRVGRKK
jgi:hypothetical protein